MPGHTLRVIVVDDTLLYRKILSDALNAISGVEVVGTAANGHFALNRIEQLNPDLVTLDFEMPEMDGLETLRQLKARSLSPHVLMVSAYTQTGARITLDALDLGAFDFITKPEGSGIAQNLEGLKADLEAKLAPLMDPAPGDRSAAPVAPSPARPVARPKPIAPTAPVQVVAIGISTGGPNALSKVIPKLPGNLKVPVVIVQHMPALFTAALAETLDKKSAVTVVEGQPGQTLEAGTVYIAPGGQQMKVVRQNNAVEVVITDDPPENYCKPAVDYLFRSVSQTYGARCLGVIMTGMGSDGVKGLQMMVQRGASVIAQDESSSVVFGMPAEAIKAGVVDTVLPLDRIAPEITRIVHNGAA